MYDQLFELTIQVCNQFPSFTPISIRDEDAEEVIEMFARFILLAKRRNAGKCGEMRRNAGKSVVGRSGQRYIIHDYEDDSGLRFGG